MKVKNIVINDSIDTIGRITRWFKPWTWFNRWHVLKHDVEVWIYTDVGLFKVKAKERFGCDGRSGGIGIDWLFPNWGNQLQRAIILMHDIFFQGFDYSFELANELLQACMIYIGCSETRANIVYKGVSTDIARNAFGCTTEKELENKKLCSIEWVDK